MEGRSRITSKGLVACDQDLVGKKKFGGTFKDE